MMKKRIMTIVLCFSLLMTSGLSMFSANAAETTDGTTFTSEGGGYIATKLSHADKGVKTADGIVDYAGNGTVTDKIGENGVGDRAQSYSWSAIGYGDYVYIGTCANAMTSTLSLMKSALGDKFDEDVMKATLNAMFNGHFFVAEEDGGDPKGILIKLNVKTGEVKLLLSKATTGTNVLFRNAVEYKGMLYFCGAVNGIPSIYQLNPETDETACVYQSVTQEEYIQGFWQKISVSVRGMCVFNDKLVVSLVGLDGAYICATDKPSDKDSYEVVADMEDLFNYPAYHYTDSIYGGSIWEMAVFNNSLYVSICTGTPENKPDDNSMQSFAIVRANIDDSGKWNWTSVVGDTEQYGSKYTFGIDPERTRAGAATLMVYGDYLYIGEYNDEEIAIEDIMFKKNCNFINANLQQSVNLYRMDKDENIELVMGDADEMFPDGSLSGYGSGFGRNENQYIWRMQVYDDKLYVGTFDTSSLLEPIGQFTNGDLLEMSAEEWESQIAYLNELIAVMESKKETPSEVVTASDIDSSLTSEQKKNAVSLGNDIETIKSIDMQEISEAVDINSKLDELNNMIDDNVSQEFLDKYTEIFNQLQALYPELPAIIKDAYSDIITKEMLENIASFVLCGAYMSNAVRGFDLYIIDEDCNVETVTTNGFGDPYNHGCRVFAVTDSGLTIGTANPFYGTQVWSLESVAYDKYDVNRDRAVNVMDCTYIQKYSADIITVPEGFEEYADLNGDGAVNVLDSTLIQRYLVNIE